ncbi:MAG: GNAT family N-acetyltransferase [Gammaproteobacteria bacterium]|nr:GNAT family N-acetyltransferase [Gammaproteobacteria bacterium]MBU1553488.1 GNAT family N-acetyltransferase [Gammaproteobacteria bacterium]MBU2072298.1 GNAT family N-acetyltransferase [Gammaproteobacteria bacterium]MBU2183150.1 GNAT family N-acetyltransferase [Gammaproteobacteria bacterium]MBU2203768.1 GNAT family N-acetyltransferase [Gammaproteobacteria bacterium]
MYQIRPYQPGEEPLLRELFYNTVHNVNQRDYTPEQRNAWAPAQYDENAWAMRMLESEPYVALDNDTIVGFADVQNDGYIDFFFCHHAYQGKGVGKALMQHILKTGKRYGVNRFYANVSLTAKPFFQHYGFTVLTEQQKQVRDVVLTNFLMEKR